MKRKKGFTLVELLATLAVLSIILGIAIPKIGNMVKESRKRAFFTDSKSIIRQIQYKNQEFREEKLSNLDLGMNLEGINLEDSIAYKNDETIYLNLIGKDKYDGMFLCNVTRNTENIDVKSESCDNYKYFVFFDANGGNLDTTLKEVEYGLEYGELPTPTRPGYTFKGWNGKNLINKELSNVNGIRNESGFAGFTTVIFNNAWIKNNLNPNTRYTISYDVKCILVPVYDTYVSSRIGLRIYSYTSGYTDMSLTFNKRFEVNDERHFYKTFVTVNNLYDEEANYNIIGYTNQFKNNGTKVSSTMIFSKIQLEEGETATEYEPYYILPSTKVVQKTNHTLKAIWEANN